MLAAAYTLAAIAFAIGTTCLVIIDRAASQARDDTAERQAKLDGFVPSSEREVVHNTLEHKA